MGIWHTLAINILICSLLTTDIFSFFPFNPFTLICEDRSRKSSKARVVCSPQMAMAPAELNTLSNALRAQNTFT